MNEQIAALGPLIELRKTHLDELLGNHLGICRASLWLKQRALTNLDVPSGRVQLLILLVSTPAIFLMTLSRVEKDPKARLIVDHARYIVILAAAVLLGAYLHAPHEDPVV